MREGGISTRRGKRKRGEGRQRERERKEKKQDVNEPSERPPDLRKDAKADESDEEEGDGECVLALKVGGGMFRRDKREGEKRQRIRVSDARFYKRQNFLSDLPEGTSYRGEPIQRSPSHLEGSEA